MFKILVTGKIDDVGIKQLQSQKDFEVDLKFHLPMPELLQIIQDYEGLITRSETAITEELLDKATRLKLIARGGVGVDNIDIDAATRHGVYVCNTPGANTIAATEQTFALLLSLMRHTFHACHNLKNERQWHRTAYTGSELFGKRLGIVGLGRIGSQVARRALAFEMQVSAYDPYISPDKAEMLGARYYENLSDMLREIDILTVHVPKTKETNGMIGAVELALLPVGARVVNCARGGIIDETALLDALNSDHLAGAALDVFASEPAADHPLLELSNVVVTPHLGASTIEAQAKVGEQLADQVIHFFIENQLDNMLNVPMTDSGQMRKVQPLSPSLSAK